MITKHEVILKVSETLNITKAAESLGYTQSGISHIINNFEEEIGMRIFQRSRVGVNMTPTGARLIPYIKDVVEKTKILDNKIEELSKLNIGIVKIATLTTIGANVLPAIIKKFGENFPNISIELADCSYSKAEDLVSQGKADLAFVPAPTKKGLDSLCIFTDNFVVISSKSNCLSNNDHVKLEDLKDQKMLLIDGINRDIKALYTGKEQLLDNAVNLNSTYVTIKMVEKNVGISLFPESIARDNQSSLNIYKIEDVPPREICMIAKDFSKLSPSASKFVKFFENEKPDTL